jgi:hypothetical protein
MTEEMRSVDLVTGKGAATMGTNFASSLLDKIEQEDDVFEEKTGIIVIPDFDQAMKISEALDHELFIIAHQPLALMNPTDYTQQEIYDISKEIRELNDYIGDTVLEEKLGGYIELQDDSNVHSFLRYGIRKQRWKRKFEKGFWKRSFPVLWFTQRLVYEAGFEETSYKISDFIIDKEQRNGICLSRFRLCPFCGENSVELEITEPNDMTDRIAVCNECDEWIKSSRREHLQMMTE